MPTVPVPAVETESVRGPINTKPPTNGLQPDIPKDAPSVQEIMRNFAPLVPAGLYTDFRPMSAAVVESQPGPGQLSLQEYRELLNKRMEQGYNLVHWSFGGIIGTAHVYVCLLAK